MLACALCVGSQPEPYLEATLASIAPVVDLLVVNENSGAERGPNLGTLERSALWVVLLVAFAGLIYAGMLVGQVLGADRSTYGLDLYLWRYLSKRR